MSMLLIILASGWTVLYQDIDMDSHAELFIPVIALIVIVHILCACLTFVDIDSSHRYHDFSGVEGWVLFTTKLLIWCSFTYTYFQTSKKLREQRKSLKYLNMLYGLGSGFLLAIPITILTTFMFAPYERQNVFDLLSHGLMFTMNIFLLYEVSYKGSSWAKINLDSFGLLPSNLGRRRD